MVQPYFPFVNLITEYFPISGVKMIDSNIIYNNIKELCKKQGITITQFERILNFGEGSISKWRSSYPSIYRVFYVAKYFNVSIDYLVGRTQITSLSDDIFKRSRYNINTNRKTKIEQR